MKKLSLQNNQEKSISDAFQDFIKYCKVKNLSEQTIVYYENCFKNFIQHFPNIHLCNEITEKTICDYILYLKGQEITNSSVNTYLRGIRAIIYYRLYRTF